MILELNGLLAGAIAAVARSFGVNRSSAISFIEQRRHLRQAVHDAVSLLSRSYNSVDAGSTMATAKSEAFQYLQARGVAPELAMGRYMRLLYANANVVRNRLPLDKK